MRGQALATTSAPTWWAETSSPGRYTEGRFSLLVGFSVAILTSVMAIVLGLISGWYPVADKIIMRIVDGLLAIPTILLAIAVILIFRRPPC